MKLKKNDWVTGYSKGYFRIEKIFEDYYDETSFDIDEHKVGDLKPGLSVHLKKGFNANLKPMLGWDVCDISFCKLVDKKTLKIINETFSDNNSFKDKFESFELDPVLLIHNMNLSVKKNRDAKAINQLIDYVSEGRTFIDIIAELKSLGIKESQFTDDSLIQFLCFDYEMDCDKRKIFREARIVYK
ncbi:MAG TPA: hypothetical protein PKK43_12320 [Spirochaetota bacterium]|nr:hypothetical protein [Spirochaetota bacterium]